MLRVSRMCLTAALLIVSCSSDASEQAMAHPKRALILHSHSRAMPVIFDWERGLFTGLAANMREPVAIDVEYLAFERLVTRKDRDVWVDLLRRKYADAMPDVVVPVNNAAAVCIAQSYPDLFPQAAVVFCSVNEQLLSRLSLTSRMTGVAYRLDYQATLETACRLFPDTHTAIVVSGLGEDDVAMCEQAKAAFAQEKRIQVTFWTGLAIADLCDRLSRLESGTIILYLSHECDRAGRLTISSVDVARRISDCARAPVFGLYDTLMGSGIVGGKLAVVESQGERAGTIAARVMQGERPSEIPISGTEMNCPMFDWRQLRRWGIDEDDLPDDSVVLFREPTIWETYWAYITAALTAIALQALLIGALLVNRRRRRRAERTVADQLQFETVLSDISSRFVGITSDAVVAKIERALACIVEHLRLDRGALFRLSEDGRELRANIAFVRAGEAQPPDVVALDSIPWMWAQLARGDVFHVSSTSDLPAEAFHERELANRLGVKSVAAVALQDNEKVVGMFTFGLRTHERAWDERILQRIRLVSEVIGNALSHIRADEALAASRNETRQLAGRILTAQEDERKRIARELHDDVSQRLAAGAIEAGKAERDLAAPQPARTALAGLKEHLIALSDDVHRLSRQLHPAILDDLGLKDALRAECDRVAERERLAVNFRCGQLPARVPIALALCVYRIAQEALRNAVKHAQADRVDVTLNADLEFLDLEVRDFGRGFDPPAARKEAGLGLASMEERVRLVGGELSICSGPG
ncbi:MAG: GAF domain-containing protein, partial [Planctomycetes bacterium]|nr:GAF domain-containing protein [Planctomycetota bacterium]